MAHLRSTPPASPAPRQSRSQSIVDAIVKAYELSPDDSSLRALASHAGVGMASLHRYFPNRESLYREVMRRRQLSFLQEVLELASTPNMSIDERIEQICLLAVQSDLSDRKRAEMLRIVPLAWQIQPATTKVLSLVEALIEHVQRELLLQAKQCRERVIAALSTAYGVWLGAALIPTPGSSRYVVAMRMKSAALLCLHVDENTSDTDSATTPTMTPPPVPTPWASDPHRHLNLQ